jgi:DNA-binding NtrC family response regulator
MNPAVALRGMVGGRFERTPEMGPGRVPGRPTVLIASLDGDIRTGLSQTLPRFPINTVWAKSVDEARNVLATMNIAACFCEIWLQGGTCRELIWLVRRKSADMPVIIVSSSNSSNEYCEWLAAMKMKALYFLTYPNRQSDIERFIQLAMASHSGLLREETVIVL